MADLGSIGTVGYGGTYLRPEGTDITKATATAPTSRPAPQGGLIIIAPTGGVRG